MAHAIVESSTAMVGLISGATMRNRIVRSFAPSIYADSIRESGMASIAVLHIIEL